MDWTTQLLDDRFGNKLWDTKTSRLTVKAPRYTPIIAYCFTLNYVIGVGALGIPLAFRSAGIITSTGITLLVGLVTAITVSWMVEVSSLGQAIHTDRGSILSDDDDRFEERRWNVNPAGSAIAEFRKKLEVSALCKLILGRKGQLAFQVALLFLMYSGLWAYSSVFTASVLGVVQMPVLYSVGVFALLVIPLSTMDLTEQWLIQVVLTAMRALTFLLMILSCLVAIIIDSADTTVPSSPYITDQVWYGITGIGFVFTTSTFSLLFQHSVPGLMHPLEDRPSSLRVFYSAIITCLVLYIILGLLTNLYFGGTIESSVNLNWASFTYGFSKIPIWGRILNIIIVVFPALDTLSVFPLIAVTLGNNLEFAFPSRLKSRYSSSRIKLLCRLLASIPPIICSFFEQDLGIILKISGVFAVYIALFNPSLLMYYARVRIISILGYVPHTRYTSPFSHSCWLFIVIVLGVLAILSVIGDMIC